MSVPTPRVLDHRPPAAAILTGGSSAPASTTAAALGAYHAELVAAGLPPTTVAELVLAAGRTLIHTAGLTASVPSLTGEPTLVTLGGPTAACHCARPRGAEGKRPQ
ncbi:hypothetical protein [Kitasatospora cineracea]|uniref:hypothetical protein n=1 Tax=Kitasatospora cineracea TaxID=88074 RepID=UPI0036BEB65F